MAVVEDDAGASRPSGDVTEGSAEGRERKVRNYAEPGEECGCVWVEAGGEKLFGQSLVFEVDRRVG